MFAVFGINQAKARAMAIKKTPKTTGRGAALSQLTPEEYQEALNTATEKYMQQMKPVILSGEFATPETCQQFIEMAVKGGGKALRSDDKGTGRAQSQRRQNPHEQKLAEVRQQQKLRTKQFVNLRSSTMNISITAEKVSINFSNTAPALAAGVISSLSIQQPGELEWSETLCNGERVDYAAAEKAVAKLGDGWRLPTRQELESLLDLSRHDPAIDTDKYPNTKSAYYWTSSKCAWNEEARWVVGFNGGVVNDYRQLSYACVRAVRASQ